MHSKWSGTNTLLHTVTLTRKTQKHASMYHCDEIETVL